MRKKLQMRRTFRGRNSRIYMYEMNGGTNDIFFLSNLQIKPRISDTLSVLRRCCLLFDICIAKQYLEKWFIFAKMSKNNIGNEYEKKPMMKFMHKGRVYTKLSCSSQNNLKFATFSRFNPPFIRTLSQKVVAVHCFVNFDGISSNGTDYN